MINYSLLLNNNNEQHDTIDEYYITEVSKY